VPGLCGREVFERGCGDLMHRLRCRLVQRRKCGGVLKLPGWDLLGRRRSHVHGVRSRKDIKRRAHVVHRLCGWFLLSGFRQSQLPCMPRRNLPRIGKQFDVRGVCCGHL